MSQKEDVVFCKIAIANGLVTEADAQKVLALCDKREREAGQRPLIGAVFSKYNLLKQQDVQKVYEAVKKRTGVAVGPAKSAGGARRKSGAGRRRGAEPVEGASKPIDPATLWMGIGGIVVLVVIVGTMLFLVLKKDRNASQAVATPAPENVPAAAAAQKEPPKKAAPAVKPPPNTDLSKEEVLDVKQTIMDARGVRGDKPDEGLKLLEGKKKALEAKGRVAPKDLLDAIKEFAAEAKQAASAGGATAETPAAEPAPADAAAAATKPAAGSPPSEKKEEAAGDSDPEKLLEDPK